METSTFLHRSGLKETQPRLLVLHALSKMKKPISAYELQRKLAVRKHALNIATIYRVLDAFEHAHLVHKHPCDNSFSLCTLPEQKGHHGFLHCTSCGVIAEFCNRNLCKLENQIANAMRFTPSAHVSEMVGLCHSCRH